MRILEDKSSKKLGDISLFLTKKEAIELIGYLKQLVEEESGGHSHLMSEDHTQEVMLCIYDEKKVQQFAPRIQKLIINNE